MADINSTNGLSTSMCPCTMFCYKYMKITRGERLRYYLFLKSTFYSLLRLSTFYTVEAKRCTVWIAIYASAGQRTIFTTRPTIHNLPLKITLKGITKRQGVYRVAVLEAIVAVSVKRIPMAPGGDSRYGILGTR